jgi:hypothetical protein
MLTKLLAGLAMTVGLGVAGAALAPKAPSAGDCCYPGSPCCYPGSPCCESCCAAGAECCDGAHACCK